MARKHVGKRVVLVLWALCLGTPLLMGQGCSEGLWLLGLFGAGQMGEPRCPTLINPLTVDAGDDLAVAAGGSVRFEASATGGTIPYTIAWSPTTGLSNPSALSPTFTATTEGQFTFTLTVTDAAGCSISDALVVTVSANDGDSGHGIGGDGDGGDSGTDGSAQPQPLVVDAGPDRTGTVGASMLLQGSFSGGTGPFTISWSPASSLIGSNTLTPTFTPTSAGDFTFTLTVTDSTGASENDSMVVSVSALTSLSSLRWGANFAGESYQLLAEFSKAVDKASAERLTNYRIRGTETTPVSAVLSSDMRTVVLVFADVKLTAKAEFDISVGSGVLDSNGSRVPQVKGLVPAPNTEDTTAPKVALIRWAVNYNGSYGVELVFNEAMDQSTLENARSYEIHDDGVSAVGFDAQMGLDGKTVSLVFYGVPLSQAAKLSVGLLTIRDINGQKLQFVDKQAISANSNDLDPPLVVDNSIQFVVDYSAGGYQVVLDLNEAMDRVSVEDPTAYLIDGLAVSAAKLGDNGRHVTLKCANNSYSPNSKLSIVGNRVKDINGRYLAARTNVAILPASSTGAIPSVPVLTWLKGDESTGYQFLARFNESMDKTTVENTKNWRINGTSIRPTSVVLSTQTVGDEIAGRTAKVTFGDFGDSGTTMSRTTKVDVSIGDSITDITGQKLAQVTCAIGAHPGDTISPFVAAPSSGLQARPAWGDILSPDGYHGDTYVVSVVFSETMDATSTMDATNYYLAGVHPTSVVLGPKGREVVLTFANIPGGLTSAEKLKILGNVRDINGRRTSSVVSLQIQSSPDDMLPPGISDMFWGINKGPYEVAVTFDEVMDAESATNVAAYTIDGLNPTAAIMQPDGKTIVLVFGNSVLTPSLELSIVGQVKDLNGNAYDGSHGAVSLPAAPSARPETDRQSPRLASAMWAIDSLDYRIVATFTEALDASTAGIPDYYEAAAGFNQFKATSAVLMPGGTTVETVFADFGNAVPGQLPPSPLNKTAQLNVVQALGGVMDMHGWLSRTSMIVGANPQDVTAVELLMPVATWAANFDQGGYRLTVTFAGEVLDARSAEETRNYVISRTFVNPTNARLSGVDDLPRGVYAGRTVFLTFARKPMSIDTTIEVSVGGSITDMSGNSMAQISQLPIDPNPEDTTPPEALEAGPGAQLGQIMVTFSEAMDETSTESLLNYTLFVDPSDPQAPFYIPYAVSLDNDGMTAYLQFDLIPQTGMTLRITGVQDVNGLTIVDVDLTL
ncbi:MAG: PKD domain-containing protein [Phycisphaerae bacterium]